MRWALVKVVLAVTTMVVLVFAVPLGLVVQEQAHDRAMSHAERQSAALGPVLAITTDRTQLERAVASTQAGADGRITVHVPAGRGSSAVEIGRQRVSRADLDTATRFGRASTVVVPGGYALLQPIAVSSGSLAVVEVFVPEGDMTRGVTIAWLLLGLVGAFLVLGSVVIADRLGTRVVRPVRLLADAAHELGQGNMGVRVRETGPSELRAAAVAFNSMANQVNQLLTRERELAADLSHRLRTPLTVLRLNAASLGDGPAAEQTREAVAQLEREVDQIIRTVRARRSAYAASAAAASASAGCDAAEVIRERMGFWSALAEDQGRQVRTAGADRPVRVPLARAELVAALDAMLGNVFRHTPEGTAFAVDVHSSEDTVIILVSDAGPGIKDPDAALCRGQGDGGPGSTGLGLDIVRRVAESTGGDVAIGNSVLGGTEVRVRLALRPSISGGRQRRRRPRRWGQGREIRAADGSSRPTDGTAAPGRSPYGS
ncbi:MAG: HAMP domain-containing histidine kinase [Streptomycetaceae bacterium]|nr:HAMP domain-containing histidine kinase [Streptomycetaceae bacterium]